MKNLFQTLRTKGVAMKAAVAGSIVTLSSAASAELPTWATGMGDTFSGHVTDAAAMVGPVIALSVGSVVVIKMIKRFSNKI